VFDRLTVDITDTGNPPLWKYNVPLTWLSLYLGGLCIQRVYVPCRYWIHDYVIL